MADYIDRDLTIQYLCEACSNFEGNICTLSEECEDIRIIRAMSAENVQPVRRGEWEIFWQNGKPKLKCTNCHSLFDIRTNDKHICIYPKFCEECGADMMKEG